MALRMLHVVSSLSASGGAEHGLVREITAFSPDVEQMVVRLFSADALEPKLMAAGIETRHLGLSSHQSGWNWVLGARRLKEHLSEFAPDVVHTTLASGNLVGQLAAEDAGVPVLSTFTLSGDPRLMKRYQPGAATLRARFVRQVEGHAARKGHVWFRALTRDAAVSNGRALRIDENRITVIPRGVPLPTETAGAPAELGLPTDKPILLNVGRQTAQKGHGDLIEVFARVIETVPSHLVILGRTGDTTELLHREIDRHGVRDHVTVADYVSDPFPFYRAASLMVFPSFMEGLGTAVLEAMASNLPVVAYDIPPVREILGDSQWGQLVDVGDTAALADEVVRLLSDESEARRIGTEARQRVVEGYSLEHVADRVEQLLREVAAADVH